MTRIYMPKKTEELPESFFARNSESVAKDLLGRTLVRKREGEKNFIASIREIAAWEGDAMASRYEGILNAPGTIFIPIQYGKPIFGLATDAIGKPSCVTLISAIVGNKKEGGELIKGPGNLSKALAIDKDSFDGLPLRLSPLWISGQPVESERILKRNKSNVPDNCIGYFYFR